MSGIVGILQLDGSAVDPFLLGKMTAFMASRGPDAQETWAAGPVGFGHAMLRTTTEAESEHQPASLDGRLWITADARIDDRSALVKKLQGAGHACPADAADSELILHSYAAWGDACVDHLIGDFAFAIWDGSQRRLFCARDQFGVKPFYYTLVKSTLIFSNTLDCIRLHPAVSARLNDLAIADFLLFDFNQDLRTTSFADIQRIPAAHTLTCNGADVRLRRYWELPVPEPISRPGRECVEQFRELLDTAVADRLRVKSVGVLMSGGLDSPTVAASAQRVFAQRGDVAALHAHTLLLDALIPHEERHYATLVAAALNIPITFRSVEDCRLFGVPEEPSYYQPQPAHTACLDSAVDLLRNVAVRSRVALTGTGADPSLSCRLSVHFRQLIRQKRTGRALLDAARYLSAEGRLSRLYFRTRLGILLSRATAGVPYPCWLNKDLEKRLGLRDRWESLKDRSYPNAAVRPFAYESMADPIWQNMFELSDVDVIRTQVESRHPFFDLRLVNFLLALPTLPWCADKELLRQAGRGTLPDPVRLRRKSPLLANPLTVLLERSESQWVDRFVPASGLECYVDRAGIPQAFREKDPWKAHIHLRPLSLNYWLQSREKSAI